MPTRNMWQNRWLLRLGLALIFGLTLLAGLLLAIGVASSPDVALAQGPTIRYVDCVTGDDSDNDCITSAVPCATVQHAVDEAAPGDEIRVATGVYTGVQGRPAPPGYPRPPDSGMVNQVVYISKTVTVQGGYTTANNFADPPDPVANPTTLDALEQGRVLYISGDISPTVEGLHITGGFAAGLGGSPLGDCGGGVLITDAPISASATVTLNGNDVIRNNAVLGGGLCIYNRANVTLIGNTISSNNKDRWWSHAAGIYVRESSGVKLIANTISGNGVVRKGKQIFGGAAFVLSDDVTLIGNMVSGNTGPNSCGGLCFRRSSDVTLDGNVVVDNYAGGGAGGGLWISNSDVVLTNTVIAGNQVNLDGFGSGLYIAGSSARLLHPTIARNGGGDGSGVYITGTTSATSTVAMINTILVSHTVGITVAADNTATLTATLWGTDTWANLVDWGGAGTIITGTINLWDNPDFVDPNREDYHIGLNSAAIDAGVDAGVDGDIDGDRRDAAPDLGADEFVHRVYLPLVLRSSG